MFAFDSITADQVVIAVLALVALREALIMVLPASAVGPHGWLLRIDESR